MNIKSESVTRKVSFAHSATRRNKRARCFSCQTLVFFLLFMAANVFAQDFAASNLNQLVQEAYSDSFYIPYSAWQWQAFSLTGGEPWWVDCSEVPCASLLPVSTNLSAYGVQLIPVRLTKNIFTGETLVQSDSATDVVARVAAPSGYQPGQQSSQDAMVWRMWQQATNCPDCWGIEGAFPAPTVLLKTFLANVNDYATYESNAEAEAEAEAAYESNLTAQASAATHSGFFGFADDSGEFGMDSLSCMTDQSSAFSITSISQDTQQWTTIVFQPTCPDSVYVIYSTDLLASQTAWNFQTSLLGDYPSTIWTDQTTPGVSNRFYQVGRASATNLNDGIPYGWAASYGLNPFDLNLAWESPAGDCLDNLQNYLQGSDPLTPGPILIAVGPVYAGSTTNTASVVPNLAPLYSFSGGSPLGIIQGTDSNFYGIANVNVMFKLSPQGTLTTQYQFTGGTNGYYASVPIQGSDSNFYGVCSLGGKSNVSFCNEDIVGYGTVFKVTPQGGMTRVHDFAGPPEGSYPIGGLVQATDGNFYGVTWVGGSNNCLDSYCCDQGFGGYGTVFKVTPEGTLTTIHIFSGGSDGADPRAALLQGSDGNLYGTTSAGNGNAGTVFKTSTDGATFATLHAFTGGTDGATPLAALIQDSGGNLYGTTYGGGTNGFGTVFKVGTNTTGATFAVLHPFGGIPDGSYPGAGLVQRADGNFYGTTEFGGSSGGDIGSGNGTLFRITPQGVLTTLYQFSGGADGRNPDYGGLVQGSDGYLYGTAFLGGSGGYGTVFKFLPATYTWSITGATFTAGQGSPYLAFTAASACPVTLSMSATNGFGCTNSGSITVTPSAPLPSANSPITVGQPLNLSVATVTGTAYKWTGPNSFSSTNQNPTITNTQPCAAGQYCVAVNGSGCTSLASCVSVIVNTPQPTSNSPVCAGQPLNLLGPAVTAATYNWTGPGGFSSTNQNPVISNVSTNAAGVYCVAVTVSGCTAVTNCTSVTVNSLPTAIVTGGTNTICQETSITIQASLSGAPPWIVTWSDGVITTNNSSSVIRTVTPYSNTTYTVTALSDTNCSGGTHSGSTTVIVTTNLTTSVIVSNEVLVIYNSNTNFPDSLACKNYYINHRPGFSNANVLACSCTTTGTDGFESITTANLTNQIINPIISFVQSNATKSIHYVVLMYGMPSRVSDGTNTCSPSGSCGLASVQHHISRCMSDAGYTSGSYYEGSTCPFVATNYLGTTCLATALNLATLADCTAYVDKVTSMYTSNVIISAKAAGYNNNTYYLDDARSGPGNPDDNDYSGEHNAAEARDTILAQNAGASIIFNDALYPSSAYSVITNGTNIKGYLGWGTHNGTFNASYATNGSIVWFGSSKWWIIETIESANGDRDSYQGSVEEWFAPNAWGASNYNNTPVGAVSHVEEPGVVGVNGPTYMSLWEAGYLLSECAWASKNTPCFQAIGDPLVKR